MKQPANYSEPVYCDAKNCHCVAEYEFSKGFLCDSCAHDGCESCGFGEPDYDTKDGFICADCLEHRAAALYDRMKDRD